MKIGAGEFADAPLLAAAILSHNTGYGVFKYLDVKLDGARSCWPSARVLSFY